MWYWVKSPDGNERDFNVDELKLALGEGRVQPDWMGRRHDEEEWFPVYYLLREDQGEVEKPPAPAVSVVCGRCRKSFSIELPIDEIAYRCPECRTCYQVSKVSEAPLIYMLMPEAPDPSHTGAV